MDKNIFSKSILIILIIILLAFAALIFFSNWRHWREPVPISAYEGNAFFPEITINGQGDALVIWEQQDGYSHKFKLSSSGYSKGKWKHINSLPLYLINKPDILWPPDIAFLNKGAKALCVFSQLDFTNGYLEAAYSSPQTIYSSSYDTSKGWTTAETISSQRVGAYHPQIAIDSKDIPTVIWRQIDTHTYQIYAAKYPSNRWGSPEIISNNFFGDAYNPRIVIDPKDNVVAIWDQAINGHYKICTNRALEKKQKKLT